MKNENKRLDRFKLLSADEHALVLYDALHDKDLTKFFFLLKQGYGLSAFILNVMIDFGYEKNLVKALEVCNFVGSDVYDFLCIYWGKEMAEDFLVEKDFKNIIKKKFSVASLVKYQFWDVLVGRKEYVALIKAGKLQIIKDLYLQDVSCRQEISEALLKTVDDSRTDSSGGDDVVNHVINIFVELEVFEPLSYFSEGVFKLLELKKWKYLPYDRPEVFGKRTLDDVLQLVYEAGGEEYFYKVSLDWRAKHRLDFQNFLMNNKYYDYYVADKKWLILAAKEAYDVIDWEDFVENGLCSNEYIWEHAAKAGKWALLAKYHKHKLLFDNWCFIWWLKSFKK